MASVTTKTMLPGQYGTKRLMKKYGDKLLAVRYRLDKEQKKKLKTVEIITNEWDYKENRRNSTPPNKIVHLYIEYGEKDLGLIIRYAGGFWNKEEKYWELPYGMAVQLGLEERIIGE